MSLVLFPQDGVKIGASTFNKNVFVCFGIGLFKQAIAHPLCLNRLHLGKIGMLLQDKQTGALIEIADTVDLVNPAKDKISGRVQSGQEEQDQEPIAKDALIFPSGESLPRCWVDANYREQETAAGVPK